MEQNMSSSSEHPENEKPTKKSFTFQNVIFVIKYSIFPIGCWPLPANASDKAVQRYKIWWWFTIVHISVGSLGWLYSIYVNRGTLDDAIRITTETTAVVMVPVKMMICKMEAPRLQGLIDEMESFLRTAAPKELELLQQYVKRYMFSHAIIYAFTVIGPIAFICGPTVTAQPLPGETAYPFSIETPWVFISLYVSHFIIVTQIGSTLVLSFMYTILLWYNGARFEMLCTEFRNATTEADLKRCIRKHHELLDYFHRLRATTRIMALLVFTLAIFGTTTGGFVLSRHPPPFIVAKFVIYEFHAVMQLFRYTWPADNIIEMSHNIGTSAYNGPWIGKSPRMLKSILLVLERSKTPLTISVNGILPALSLELSGAALAASFSYLTTLRAMTDSES